MRLLARCLSLFITSQIINLDSLRINSTTSTNSNSALGELKTLKKNKSYAQLTQIIDTTISFLQDSNRTILDSLIFLGQLVKNLYDNKKYLADIIVQSQ